MGRKSIQRLSPEEESGRIEGGKRNVEASIIIGTSGRTNEKNESKSGIGTAKSNSQEQEQTLKDYARNVGIWLNYNIIAKKSFKQFPSGAESKVFLYKDENNEGYIIKVTDYKIMEEKKKFDCLKMKEELQAKVYEKTKDISSGKNIEPKY